MEDLHTFQGIFNWFMNLEFNFCGVHIKVSYLFIFSFFMLVIKLFFNNKGDE